MFTNYGFMIQDTQKREVIVTGKYAHGLYFLKGEPESSSAQLCLHSNKSIFDVPNCNFGNSIFMSAWYARLSHLSNQVLKTIHNKIPDLFH